MKLSSKQKEVVELMQEGMSLFHKRDHGYLLISSLDDVRVSSEDFIYLMDNGLIETSFNDSTSITGFTLTPKGREIEI